MKIINDVYPYQKLLETLINSNLVGGFIHLTFDKPQQCSTVGVGGLISKRLKCAEHEYMTIYRDRRSHALFVFYKITLKSIVFMLSRSVNTNI